MRIFNKNEDNWGEVNENLKWQIKNQIKTSFLLIQ